MSYYPKHARASEPFLPCPDCLPDPLSSAPSEKAPDSCGPDLYTCPGCAFSFAAEHAEVGGVLSCPCCEEARLLKEVAELEAQHIAIRNAALEEAAELAIAQAKLLIGDYAAFGLCDLANAIRALKTSALDDSAAKVGGCLDDSGGGT